VAGVRSRPPAAPSSQVSATAITAPTNAARGTPNGRFEVASPVAARVEITAVTPRPAPAATPSRCGSARGLRNTPWYAAPASASIDPTSSPSTTRGSRSSRMIAISRSDRPLSRRTPGMMLRSSAATLPGGRLTGPNATPATIATATANRPPASQATRRPAGRGWATRGRAITLSLP
jgi:hypothetical protein